jgi:hypothetical protein
MSNISSDFLTGRKLVSYWRKRRFVYRNFLLLLLLSAATFLGGCSTTVCQEHPENYARAFDSEKVARLSHEAYQVAWHANFWARRDLRVAAFRPTQDDWEAVNYLRRLYQQAPWVARDIEKHPATPRCSSQGSYDSLRFNATMFRRYYRPASYQAPTDSMIQNLIRILDEIDSFYKASSAKPKTTTD